MTKRAEHPVAHKVETLESVVIRFAGDSGDGMQVTGDRFTTESAVFGNDLATLPNFPAEIRAPAGTLPGVSAFQVQIAAYDILTPGDEPNVLVAMNPAALRANVADLAKGGTLIVNSDAFDTRSLEKAGYEPNPLADGSLSSFRVYEIPMTSLTLKACEPTGAKPRDAERSKNFFALGIISWLYNRPTEHDARVDRAALTGESRSSLEANSLAFRAGYNFGETAELFDSSYTVPASVLGPGEYTNISGNTALAWGLLAASQLAGLRLFLGAYPITPASDLLHELAKQKHFGTITFQAEDEIAGAGAALGASFGGSLGVTTTSGPGIDLMAETIGLAVSLELPLVIVDVQRGGPSTGLPTKSEQSDLLLAMYGRHGEAPVPIVAARTPGDCFAAAIEAVRIALKYRTPVFLLSDGYLANGSEPWPVPDLGALPEDRRRVRQGSQPRRPRRELDVLALPARPRDPRPPLGGARHGGDGAPARRHREGRRLGRRLLRPGEPRADGAAAARQGRRHRGRHPAGHRRRPRRRRAAGPRLGLDLRGGDRRRRADPGVGGCASHRRTSRTSTRFRRTWPRCSAAMAGSSSRRTTSASWRDSCGRSSSSTP